MKKISLDDRIFLWFYKKPMNKWVSYFLDKLAWMIIGFFIFAGILFISVGYKYQTAYFAGGYAIVLGIILGWMNISDDNKKGYIDSMQSHYLERYNARISKIKKKLEENKSK
jgi:hypothetical protein